MRKGRVGAGESQGCVWVGSHVWLPKVPSRRTCWLRRLRHCPSSLLPATGCSVRDVVYLLGYGAQLQPAMTQSSSSRKIHLRTLFESSTPSVHKQHELRLPSASTAPCGQLPLQSPAPSHRLQEGATRTPKPQPPLLPNTKQMSRPGGRWHRGHSRARRRARARGSPGRGQDTKAEFRGEPPVKFY